MLAKPTSWVADGEERTWGLGSGRSVTKRAIPFRARQNGRARAVWCPSRLVRRRLLLRFLLLAYPVMEWDGIERTRSASAIGSVFFWGGRSLLLHKLIPAPFPVRPDRQLLGLPISPKLPPVFGPSCMRQKLVPRTVRRPSPSSNGAAQVN